MMLLVPLRRRRVRSVLAGSVFLVVVLIGMWDQTREKEIALMIGEPWEDMRRRSSATISPVIQGETWFNIPKSDARLRFIDPQYEFVTPLARFFTVNFEENGSVGSIRMSPQIEPLLLEDTLKVVLDLQDQWRKGGWRQIHARSDPPFADTPQWRARLRDVNKGGTTYWRAGNKYEAMLIVNRFLDDKRPTEERYLITLTLAEWPVKL